MSRGLHMARGATLACAMVLISVAVLPTSPAGAVGPAWTVQSSSAPAIIVYAGVSCPTALACFAIGETQSGVSVVRATSDGGTAWSDVAHVSLENALTSISCATSLDCVALDANSSTIVATTDGWSTFTYLSEPAELSSVSCDAARVCAVSATNYYGVGEVLLSTDGGTHWTTRVIPADNGGELFGPVSSGVACPSARTCLVTGAVAKQVGPRVLITDVVFRTTNGGASWTTATLPKGVEFLDDLACPSAARCYLVGGSNHNAGLILVSSTGGVTWRTALDWAAVPSIDSISCAAGGDCVAGGATRDDTEVVALRTTTAGKSWAKHTVVVGEDFGEFVSCGSVTRCAIALEPGTTTGVELSANGGTTWTSSDVPVIAPIPRAVSCPAAGTCVALGNKIGTGNLAVGLAERTTNDGATWTTSSMPVGVSIGYAITCPTTTDCMGLAFEESSDAEVFVATTDGGTTWTVERAPTGVVNLGDVSCASALICVAVGETQNASEPLYTSDGGETWAAGSLPLAPSGVTYQMTNVTCVSTTVCYAAGNAQFNDGFSAVATFFKSIDGGSSWTAISLEGGGELDSTDLPGQISCSTATTCISVANEETAGFLAGAPTVSVFETTDGGATWAEEFSIGAQIAGVGGVSCTSGGFCQMVGEDADAGTSYALTSSDGGASWSSALMPAAWLFSNAISCGSSTSCVTFGAVADGGLGVASYE